MNQEEKLLRTLDRRYRVDQVQRIRIGIVDSATDVHTYDVLLPGDTDPVVGVPSVAPVAPAVGDAVRVAMVSDQPIILSVQPAQVLQAGTQSVVFSAANSATAVVNWPVAFTVAPAVLHAVQVGANNDVLSNLQSVSATSATFRLFQKSGTAISTTATLHWQAIGL